MAEKQSAACPFKSNFGGGWVTPAQYLAESMCFRIARKDKRTLPLRFWKTEAWERPFLLQLRHANGLLKLYSAEAIIRALRTPEGKKVYSLGAQWLDPVIRVEQEKVDRQAAAREEEARKPTPAPTSAEPRKAEPPRKSYSARPTHLDRLRELDGEEEGGG